MRAARMWIAALMALSASLTQAADEGLGLPPLCAAGRCPTPPTIDGRLNDACWAQASALGPFVDIRESRLAQEQTRARLAWDDECLYVAFDCTERHMDRLVTQYSQRDAEGLWTDDAVEVFVLPPGGGSYLHWVANAAGAVFDERCVSQGEREVGWNSGVVAQAVRQARSWQLEVAIPWSDVATGPPQVGDVWRIGLNREEQRLGEWSGWAVTGSGFHEPEHFGQVVLSEVDPGITLLDPGKLFLGGNTAVLQPRVPMPRAEVSVRGTVQPAGVRWEAAAQVWDVAYTIPDAAPGRAGFQVSNAGQVVYRTGEFPLRPERVDLRLGELVTQARRLRQWLQGTKWPQTERASRLHSATEGALTDVEPLTARAQAFVQGSGDPAGWTRLGADVDRLAGRMDRLWAVYQAWYALGGDDIPEYAVGVAPSTVKVLRDTPFRGSIGTEGHLRMCRNEYEALQLVLIPCEADLDNVEVSWTDLTGPGGAMIPRSAVEVSRVGFVQTRKPVYPVSYVGWYPDPLMPLDTFTAKAGQNQPLWVGVKTPSRIVSGMYTGSVTIRPANAQATTVTLFVEVWDITLPPTTTLKTALSSWYDGWLSWYGAKATPEKKREYFKFLLGRRINPGTIYSSNPYWTNDDLRWCIEHGMSAFCVKYQGPLGGSTPAERKQADDALAQWARDYAADLRANGWIDKAYVYGFDEVGPAGYDDVVRAYSIIKREAPDLRTACTVVPNETLDPVMDIWVPLTPHLAERWIWQRAGKTDDMWWYVCCGPTHPYANWFVDYSALEHRLLFWQTFKYSIKGFLLYSMTMWHSNETTVNQPSYIVPHEDPEALKAISDGKRWPDVPWNTFTYSRFNGDGHLFYPGPNETLISSQRLENIRDGIEDYELLHELELATDRLAWVVAAERSRKALPPVFDLPEEWSARENAPTAHGELLSECRQLLGYRPKLFRDLTHFTDDPAVLESEREAVARQLMRANRVVAEATARGAEP